MPYIVPEKRDVLDPSINQLHRALVELELDDPMNNTEGNLNYAITRLLMLVYGQTSPSYRSINDVLGVLEGVKFEFYRKQATPYENQKEFDNGPVEANIHPAYLDGGTHEG